LKSDKTNRKRRILAKLPEPVMFYELIKNKCMVKSNLLKSNNFEVLRNVCTECNNQMEEKHECIVIEKKYIRKELLEEYKKLTNIFTKINIGDKLCVNNRRNIYM